MASTSSRAATLALLMSALLAPSGQPPPLRPGEFEGSAPANAVTWQFKRLAPPSPLYITRDDALYGLVTSALAGESVIFNYRLLLVTGELKWGQLTITPSAQYTVTEQFLPLAEGFLLSLNAQPSQAYANGQTYVRAGISRGSGTVAVNVEQLIADYATSNFVVSYPPGSQRHNTDGPGWMRYIAVPQPAAGAEWTQAVQTGAKWRVRQVLSQLFCSAAVASRQPSVQIKTGGGNLVWYSGASGVLTANQSGNVVSAAGLVAVPVSSGAIQAPLPWPCLIRADTSDVIGSSTLNMDVADQYKNITIAVEEWVSTG